MTEYIPDRARSIVTKNDSPDVGFTYSINPYRGCSHGCNYCYARQTHEFLGFNTGLDFETKIRNCLGLGPPHRLLSWSKGRTRVRPMAIRSTSSRVIDSLVRSSSFVIVWKWA